MEEKDLNSWFEFEQELAALESYHDSLCRESYIDVSPLLFRGQPNAIWKLDSSLERYMKKKQMGPKDYLEVVDRVRPEIETYSGKSWNIDFRKLKEWEKSPTWYFFKSFPGLEYIIYLRQHGFPSMLLDWTKSPFVAAYFAFNKIPNHVKKVAIYAYIESEGRGKTLETNNPLISSLRHRVRTHKRHFLQQSVYTLCVKKTKQTKRTESLVIFASYENALSRSPRGENHLWKFTLPSSERIKVLKKLDQMNINSLSLFDSEESLMETVALRVFYLASDDL